MNYTSPGLADPTPAGIGNVKQAKSGFWQTAEIPRDGAKFYQRSGGAARQMCIVRGLADGGFLRGCLLLGQRPIRSEGAGTEQQRESNDPWNHRGTQGTIC